MLARLFVVLGALFSVVAGAQVPQLGVTIEPEFGVTAIPEKWKNESAVIIAQKQEFLFTRPTSRSQMYHVNINEYTHKRIRLQDKNALETFSTFFYVTMGKDGLAEYKVIKSNGKEVVVDMKTAIEDDSDIPSIYRPIYFKWNVKKMKIAIPNLEVGDIIDYTVKSSFSWDMKSSGVDFTPFIFSLANNYPTLYQHYRFTMANGMKVRYRAFNGAPNIKFDAKASIIGDKNSYLSYYFLDRDREKTTEERWSYELRSTPSVKFRVVLFSDNDTESKGLGEATVDRSGLNVEDVYKRYAGAALYVTPVVNSLVGYTTEYMMKKKADKPNMKEDEIVRETYYCLRKVFLEMYYKGPVSSELEKYMTGKKLYKKVVAAQKKDVVSQKIEKEDEIRMNSVTFATALRMALLGQGIQSELFVYVPRRLGSWREAIFMEELDFMMRVKTKRKYVYLDAFNNFDAFGTPYGYMEGVEGYGIAYDEANRYMRGVVPATSPNDHVDKEDYVVSFPAAMDVVNIERTSSFLGTEKNLRIGKANLDREYLSYDFEKYFNQPKPSKKKDDMVINTSFKYDDPDKTDRVTERKEVFEKELKEEFDVDKYINFELIKDGRFGDTAWLKYIETFTAKKLLAKAGKNYVFSVGSLIGDQIKLDEKELKGRETDIWLQNARTLENKIVIKIPEGYTVDGIQELNMSVDNESGAFISTAVVEGSDLVVTTKKIYKKNFDKKEMWNNYIAFLEPAYKFSQLKVILKKK